MRRLPAVLATLLALLATAAMCAPAALARSAPRAALPHQIKLGVGQHPWLAVDSHGTAHVVWSSDQGSQPTVVHYCQIARNSKGCSHSRQLALDLGANQSTDFAGPKVAVLKSGQLLIATSRCCGGLNLPYLGASPVYGYLSSDGGATFGAPALIGMNPPSGDLEVGPGQYSVSTITDSVTLGTHYQADPIGPGQGTQTPPTSLSDGASQDADYDGTVAFVNSTTPIVAFSDIPKHTVYYRVWGGSGDVNVASSWAPPQKFGTGVSPRLTSGPKGVFLTYESGPGLHSVIRVARYDGTRFAKPVTVPGTKGAAFADVAQDASGDLELAWTDHDDVGKTRLRMSTSLDGGRSWSGPVTLAVAVVSFYDPHLRLAPDGGGLIVFDTRVGRGSIRAIALPTLNHKQSANCPTTLSFGVTRAIARQGCFSKHGKSYTIKHAIRVNGLDVDAPASGQITIEPGARRISSGGAALVHAGAVKLAKGKLDWVVPKGGGPLRDLAGNPVTLTPAKFGERFLGLKVSGWVTPSFHKGGADLPVNLVIPPPVSGGVGGSQTSDVTLHTSATSAGASDLQISKKHFHLHIADAFLGIAELKPFDLDYTADPAVLKGAATLYLPVVPNATIKTAFEFDNGEFADASADAMFKPPLPIAGTVFLNDINFHTNASKGCVPATIAGGATVSGGPQIAGVALVQVDGKISYSFPKASCNVPGVLAVNGDGKLIGIQVATLNVKYKTSGQFTLAAHVGLGSKDTIEVSSDLNGAVDFKQGLFSAEGKADVHLLGYEPASADMLVSNIGMGACLQLSPIPVPLVDQVKIHAGFKYVWGKSFTPYLLGCDIDSLHPTGLQAKAASTAAHAAAAGSVTVPRGAPSFAIVAKGPGGPSLVLTAPDGHRIKTPAAPAMTSGGKGYEAFRVPSMDETAVTLKHPRAGTWKVAAAPGSTITKVLTGKGLPKPKVAVRVRGGHGGVERLSYRVRRIAGQKVRFAERGPDTFRVLGAAKKSGKGTIRFRPGAGRGGKRAIVALIDQRGFARAQRTVAHYRAPAWGRPAKPRHVQVRRRRGKLVVSWHRASGAKRYLVRALLRDGRRLVRTTGRHKLRIGHVPGIDAGRIVVAGLRADNVPGPAGRAKLKAHPLHRAHHKKKKHKKHKRGKGKHKQQKHKQSGRKRGR